MFQVTENGEGGPDNISRPVFKKPRVKSVRKHKKRIQSHDDSGSDEEVQDTSSLPTPTRRSNRTRSVSKFFDE